MAFYGRCEQKSPAVKLLPGARRILTCKKRIGVFLAFLLIAAPAFSQGADDGFIVPGQRIGNWTLDMTVDDLLRMNGPRKAIGTVFGSWETVVRMQYRDVVSADFWIHRWDHLGLRALTLGPENQRIWSLGTFEAVYRTVRGVRRGATRGAVEGAYGKPTAITQPRAGYLHLIYDQLGLAGRISNERVDWIIVFRPGTAKERWPLRGGLLGR